MFWIVPGISGCSVLARNEEFSKIAVINFFFTVLKKKIQLSVGGILRGKFRDIPRKSTVLHMYVD